MTEIKQLNSSKRTVPWTVSSALQAILLPVLVLATQVYKPASSGVTCWNINARLSSSSLKMTWNRSLASKYWPSLNLKVNYTNLRQLDIKFDSSHYFISVGSR